MANFVNVSLPEFQELLNPEKGWTYADVPKALEHVFDWPVKRYPGVVIRVYSSIRTITGNGRRVGSDAIRVCAVDTISDKGLIRAMRVHRVEGWRENLKARIMQVLDETHKRMAAKEAQGYWKRPVPQVEKAPIPTAATFADSIPAFKFKKHRLWWFRLRLASDERFALYAMLSVYAHQTADEKAAQATVADNGIGFSGVHAEIFSSFSEQLRKKQERYGGDAYLSPKQMALVFKTMPKYAKQVIAHFEGEKVSTGNGK